MLFKLHVALFYVLIVESRAVGGITAADGRCLHVRTSSYVYVFIILYNSAFYLYVPFIMFMKCYQYMYSICSNVKRFRANGVFSAI